MDPVRPDALGVLGVGVYLPPSVDVADYAAERRGVLPSYRGWRRACHGGPDDHPSSMGERALQRALADSGIEAEQLALVIFCGVSRDYPPSWSVATEVMRLAGVGDRALGIDTMAGCLATLAALDLAKAWLAARGGGYGAVVAAERWSQTVDYSDPSAAVLWGYGDGGGALVVGVGTPEVPRLEYLGAEFRNATDNNGHVLVPYGGTRSPVAPPGVDPNGRQLGTRSREELTATYRAGYTGAFRSLRATFDFESTHLVCNQISPGVVAMIADSLDLAGQVTVTGHRTGHLGGPDLVVGIEEYLNSGALDEAIVLGASAAYAFGTGLALIPRGTAAHVASGTS